MDNLVKIEYSHNRERQRLERFFSTPLSYGSLMCLFIEFVEVIFLPLTH